MEVDGQFFGRAVQLGKNAPQRLGKRRGGVFHARGLPGAPAAPCLAQTVAPVDAEDPEGQRDQAQDHEQPDSREGWGDLAKSLRSLQG